MQRLLVSAIILLSLAVANPSRALQNETSDGDSGDEAVVGDDPDALIETITVTATKRRRPVGEVPVSISVLDEARLSQSAISNAEELATHVPNFNAGFGLVSEALSIRGIGSGQERSFEQSVAMFSDGLYLPRSRQFAFSFFDLDRVEVMRGPQAVTHGLNATAGAVSVISKTTRPGDPFEAHLSAGFELEHGGPTITAIASGSPSRTLGLRAALRFADRQGTSQNSTLDRREGDTEARATRLSAVWAPTPRVSIQTKYEYFDHTIEGNAGEIYGLDALLVEPDDGRLNWRRSSDSSIISSSDALFVGDRPGLQIETHKASIDLNLAIGQGTLSLVGGWNEFEHVLTTDVDTSASPLWDGEIAEKYEQKASELRWTSAAGRPYTVILGGYVHQAQLLNSVPSVFGPALAVPDQALAHTSMYTLDTDILSSFVQLTRHLSSRARLVAGLRFSRESKEMLRTATCEVGSSLSALQPAPPRYTNSLCPGLTPLRDQRTSENWMPELAIEWQVTPSSLLYGKASRSAKSGGFAASPAISPINVEYDDEFATAFELGLRSQLAGGRAHLDTTLFLTEYQDLQVNSFLFDQETGFSSLTPVIRNAASATSRGLEIEARWAVTQSLRVGGSLGFLDAAYDSFPDAPCNTESTEILGVCDLSGQSLPFVPKWSANLHFDLQKPVSAQLDVLANIDFSSSARYFTEGTLDPNAVQDSWFRVSARLGLADRNRKWSVSLVGRNLGEEAVLSSTQGFGSYFVGYLEPPRTVSLDATIRFQ